MSRFLSKVYEEMVKYVPGEQPKDREYIKLNANETSMLPSPKVYEALRSVRMNKLGKYADPDAKELRNAIAKRYEVDINQVFVGNGSDEVLGFIFLAFFGSTSKICFPDITYGFYEVFSKSFGINAKAFKLKDDFTVDVEEYINTDRDIVLPNPNAPTGFAVRVDDIEKMVKANKNRLVVIDEAYVDYGAESCIPLIKKYDNLIVVHTMSKSRNLAGAHIGYCIASESLIEDLNSLKFAFNPFNMSDISLAIGRAAVEDTEYHEKCIKTIIENREYTKRELEKLGFKVLDSKTNFIFVTHPEISAEEYNSKLREHGILARHYKQDRIENYLRITIGTKEEMQAVIDASKKILIKAVA